jgi:hypothetical protein
MLRRRSGVRNSGGSGHYLVAKAGFAGKLSVGLSLHPQEKWRAQEDDFRTFLREFVLSLPHGEILAGSSL